MTQKELLTLLECYQLGTITPEQEARLVEYLREDSNEDIPDALAFLLEKQNNSSAYNNNRWDPVLQKVLSVDAIPRNAPVSQPTRNIHFLRGGFIKYAAAVIIIIGIGAFFLTRNTPVDTVKKEAKKVQPDILPAAENVILTLSDGRQIVLNDSSVDNISDANILIDKKNGILNYNTGPASETSIVYNTMSTPKGGQYQLILPDGSKVWLNAASSLRYPIVFSGNKREVELTGEAYFEIKENRNKPFIVRAVNTEIAVLGTEFNVNAYTDEPAVSTTLVSGSVKVATQKKSIIIKPGQQAGVNYADYGINISIPDIDNVLAWKQGMFQFENANIKTIMRQLERWYDIRVEYQGVLPQAEFSGSLSRTENAVMLLDALSLTNRVHFIIEGKKIIVVSGKKV